MHFQIARLNIVNLFFHKTVISVVFLQIHKIYKVKCLIPSIKVLTNSKRLVTPSWKSAIIIVRYKVLDKIKKFIFQRY
jgi:hypothetical protein